MRLFSEGFFMTKLVFSLAVALFFASPSHAAPRMTLEGSYSVMAGYHMGTLSIIDMGSGEFVMGLTTPGNEDFNYSFFHVGYSVENNMIEAYHFPPDGPALFAVGSDQNYSMRFKAIRKQDHFVLEGTFTDRFGTHRMYGHQIVKYSDFAPPTGSRVDKIDTASGTYRGVACDQIVQIAFTQVGANVSAVLTLDGIRRNINLGTGFYDPKRALVKVTSGELTHFEPVVGPVAGEEKPNEELNIFHRRFVHIRGRFANGGRDFRGAFMLHGHAKQCNLNLMRIIR